MDRDIAYHAIEWSGDAVVAELLLLGFAGGGRGFVIGLGIGVGLLFLVECILADDAVGKQLPLPLYLELVVLIEGELLLFGGCLGGDCGLLLHRVDLHQRLAWLNVIAGMNQNADELAADLGVEGGRTPRFNRGYVLV